LHLVTSCLLLLMSILLFLLHYCIAQHPMSQFTLGTLVLIKTKRVGTAESVVGRAGTGVRATHIAVDVVAVVVVVGISRALLAVLTYSPC
jgi:hypothetical protein